MRGASAVEKVTYARLITVKPARRKTYPRLQANYNSNLLVAKWGGKVVDNVFVYDI